MKKNQRLEWEARTRTNHVCVIDNGGLSINGINVTLYMDAKGIFIIKHFKGRIIQAKNITLNKLNSADLDSIKWLPDSIERTAQIHNKFFKTAINISSAWAYPDGTPNF